MKRNLTARNLTRHAAHVRRTVVCTENFSSGVVVVKSAKDGV
jgi:hypothetical protein